MSQTAQALYRLVKRVGLNSAAEHIDDPNLIVGMFALRAIEELGDAGKVYIDTIAKARKSNYEFSDVLLSA